MIAEAPQPEIGPPVSCRRSASVPKASTKLRPARISAPIYRQIDPEIPVASADLGGNSFERTLQAQSGVDTNHQQIEEIWKDDAIFRTQQALLARNEGVRTDDAQPHGKNNDDAASW